MKLFDNVYFRLLFACRKYARRFKQTKVYRKLVELWELGAIRKPPTMEE